MLANARQYQPALNAILMDEAVFNDYRETKAVIEPKPANETPPAGLNGQKTALYKQLLNEEKGRLEQEFIPKEHVVRILQSRITPA
jgi:hypothetical protein